MSEHGKNLSQLVPHFFVVGFPRSGTTLLASMLNRHSQVCIPPETHFYRSFHPDAARWKACGPDELAKRFVEYPRIIDLKLGAEEVSKCLRNRNGSLAALLTAGLTVYAERHGKDIVGEKTPAHALYLPQIHQNHPDAKIIIITRDGRDCVFSNLQQEWTSDAPLRQAAEWNYYASLINKFEQENGELALIIRLEDLASDPASTMKKVCSHIGIHFEPAQLLPASADNAVPSWEADWKAKSRDRPDKSNLYLWKKNPEQQLVSVISLVMQKYLRHYNYDPSPIKNLSITRRLWVTLHTFWLTPLIYPKLKRISRTAFFQPLHRLGLSRFFFKDRHGSGGG